MTDIFSLICKPGHIHNLRSFFTCKTILCYIQENYSLNQFQKDIHLFFNAAAAVCNVELDLLVKKHKEIVQHIQTQKEMMMVGSALVDFGPALC